MSLDLRDILEMRAKFQDVEELRKEIVGWLLTYRRGEYSRLEQVISELEMQSLSKDDQKKREFGGHKCPPKRLGVV